MVRNRRVSMDWPRRLVRGHSPRNGYLRCNLDHHEIRYWALHRVHGVS